MAEKVDDSLIGHYDIKSVKQLEDSEIIKR